MSTAQLTFTSDDFIDHHAAVSTRVTQVMEDAIRELYETSLHKLGACATPSEITAVEEQTRAFVDFIARHDTNVLTALSAASQDWVAAKAAATEQLVEAEVAS